jgi:hypothetical protein
MKPHDAAVGNQGAEEEFMLPNLECGFYDAVHQEAEGDYQQAARSDGKHSCRSPSLLRAPAMLGSGSDWLPPSCAYPNSGDLL